MARKVPSPFAFGFEEYYAKLFGLRWPSLRQALSVRGPQVNLRQRYGLDGDYWLDPASCFLSELLVRAICQNSLNPLESLHEFPPGASGGASEKERPQIWDMCAAPGGKLLSLALSLPATFRLCASEVSQSRFTRLQQQVALLPPKRVELHRADACKLALRYKTFSLFDGILLDAPCSSERHVLQQAEQKPELLAEWRPSRSKRNAQNQLGLLCGALDCLAPGGYLLYATCALSPLENAAVVERALNKRASLNITPQPFPPELYPDWNFEAQFVGGTGLGFCILPDRNDGAGPLYFCLLSRPAPPVTGVNPSPELMSHHGRDPHQSSPELHF